MKGFDAEFSNLDHYIRVITARIWEGRRIDDIRLYYSDPCVVETPMSVSSPVEDVVTGTRATLAINAIPTGSVLGRVTRVAHAICVLSDLHNCLQTAVGS